MFGLTDIELHEWVMLFVLAVGLGLILLGFFSGGPAMSTRWRRLLLLVTGSMIVVVAILRYGDWLVSPGRILARPAAVIIAGAIAIDAIAIGDLFVDRIVRVLRWPLLRLGVADAAATVAALAASLLVLAASGLAALGVIELVLGPAHAIRFMAGAHLVASYPMPTNVMDIAFLGERDGFLSMADGRILRFELPLDIDAPLVLTTVADGLEAPRGLAIVDGRLFVATLGPLACPPSSEFCDGSLVGPSPAEGELAIIEDSRGQIVRFDIDVGGTLKDRRVIVDRLPVVTSWHGINGLTAGPDGLLYVSIGNVDLSWETPDAVDRLGRAKIDLLGTVVRTSPDGGHIEVVARGLRNVYGIEFDERGELYGVDNDGPTTHGWRSEELLNLREGADFGYPHEGTFSEGAKRTDGPLWLMETRGSAGIASRERFGLTRGLLTGGCGRIESIRLTDVEGRPRVLLSSDLTLVADEIQGCVTAIEPGPLGLALVSAYNLCDPCECPTGDPHPLLLIDVRDVT